MAKTAQILSNLNENLFHFFDFAVKTIKANFFAVLQSDFVIRREFAAYFAGNGRKNAAKGIEVENENAKQPPTSSRVCQALFSYPKARSKGLFGYAGA
jgi:hypothetical protein